MGRRFNFVSSHESKAQDIEIETIWSKAEDVIVEWEMR